MLNNADYYSYRSGPIKAGVKFKIQQRVFSCLVLGIISILHVQLFSQPLAAGKSKFLGNAITFGSSIPSNFTKYWNQVTPGNDGKWGSVEGTQGIFTWSGLDNIYNFAQANAFPFKEHNLIWGSQQPSWITNLDSASQRSEVAKWISLCGQRYPSVSFVDVVNEPFHAPPPYMNALGGSGKTGWDWVVTAFQMARQYFPPGTQLLLNDYNILQSNTVTSNYIALIDTLQVRGLIDGVGIQGHYFEFKSSAGSTSPYTYSVSTIKSNLDRITATGLPVYISEFDVDEANDSTQLANYQVYFPLFWEDPGVKGMTLWGYNQNDTWKVNAYLVRTDGSERPALQWLRTYLSSGNFQSYQSGSWSDTNTWSRFNGSGWIHPAPNVPSLLDGAISILSGHTVTTDTPDTTNKLTILSGGTLVIKPGINFTALKGASALVGMNVSGSVMNYGTLTIDTPTSLIFASGGKYGHEQDGGFIPIAGWVSGSLCEFDSIKSAVPSNINQNFSNVVWNCPAQASDMNLNWNGVTISGSMTIQNTGIGQLQMCAPAAGISDTIKIGGDFIQSNGQFTANGTNAGNTSIVINHSGNINITGGDFSISRGSQGGTGTTFWNISNGNFSMSNAKSQNATSTPNGARFVFSKAGTQNLTLGSGNIISSLPMEIKNGSTLSTGTSIVSGSGIFALDSGAVLLCGNAGGLDSLLKTSGTITLSKSAAYTFNGTNAQATGRLLPDSVSILTLNNSAGATLSKSVVVTGTLNMQNGALSLSSDTLSYGVNGSLAYIGTAAQTTSSSEFPSLHGPKNLVITNTNGVALHAPRAVTGNLNLSGTGKFTLGNNDFISSTVSNTSRNYYIVTQGTGALKLPSGSSSVLFPVGTKSGYAPVTVKNSGTFDTLGVSVMDDSTAAPYGGRVMVRWNIGNNTTGNINDSIQFAWLYALEDAVFAGDMQGNAKIFFKSNSDTTEAGSGGYAAQLSSSPFSLARGGITMLGTFFVGSFGITGPTSITVNKSDAVPKKFALLQNYPNPFNPTTMISYDLPVGSHVVVKVYDIIGRDVRTLVNGQQNAGRYSIEFNASALPSGVYFYRIETEKFTAVKKFLLLK